MTAELDTHQTFRHLRYAGPQSFMRMFGGWVSKPLAMSLMPVMICTLFLALQEQQIGWFLKFGTSIAVLSAGSWTLLQLARTPALVSFRNERVRVTTFLEASLHPEKVKWDYVIDVQTTNQNTSPFVTAITYGHTAYEFKKHDWEELKLMSQLLQEARLNYEIKVRSIAS